MSVETAKDLARARVAELVRNFKHNEADYLQARYNETQARTDFITPLLEAFGWDVHNTKRHPLAYREVIEEATLEATDERVSRKPDYELRLARQRKLFVEAKKPSVPIDRDKASAFQIRRYGYSASLPIAVLTNFHQLAVYDCLPIPAETDEARISRILLISYIEFESRFEEIWDVLSRDLIYSGAFDRRFATSIARQGIQLFDDYFLTQVRSWRTRLAVDIHTNNPSLTPTELTYAVQLFLSRIVFLRICEDREIESYETLKKLAESNTSSGFMALLRRADDFYDSGLFRMLDDTRLGMRVSDATLQGIISELYYPQSPYTFAVVETEVLGQIYEQFLGEVINVSAGSVEVVSKPEVRESGGVVPTPRYIVDVIVDRTLAPVIASKSPLELTNFTVADICCGSGVFLLSVYESLMDHYLSWYSANNPSEHVGHTIYEVAAGQWRLTYEEKRRILLSHLRGVDIDSNAVEVAQFSLLLKLIENETSLALRDYVARHHSPALPDLGPIIRCGNSLVSREEWTATCGPMPGSLTDKVNPFSWTSEFPAETSHGGFDVIVGNPPYIRIQHMAHYSEEEVKYYQHPASPYLTARQDNFDKYALFIERALLLLSSEGKLGLIVPHKFMVIQAGKALRRLISEGRSLKEVIHFGVQQVFGPDTSNYTCILVFDKRGQDELLFERVKSLERWRYGHRESIIQIPAGQLTEESWQFADAETQNLFDRIRTNFTRTLEDSAEIFVGIQTSADKVYIIHAISETASTIICQWDGRDWPIEKAVSRPFLVDETLSAYKKPKSNSWVIFPYELSTTGTGITARVVQPDVFARLYPQCLAYLTARRVELDGRNIVGGSAGDQQWYQYGRSQSLTKFGTPKIILPALSLESRYAYDDRNTMVSGGGNGPYYLIRPIPGVQESNYFLMAILNHPLSEAFIRTRTSTFRGGYYSHGKQFIQNLPIPVVTSSQRTEIENLVSGLIETLSAAEEARTPQQRTVKEREAVDLRGRIETIVSAIFGLSDEDLRLVRAVPIPA